MRSLSNMDAHTTDAVIAAARTWCNNDPDAETCAELAEIIAQASSNTGDTDAIQKALDELHSRFDTRLTFGTAGLRGALAAGPNRMNRVVVVQTAAGFATYLHEHARTGETPSIVIGYDGRKNSRTFAIDTAEIMAGAGVRTIVLPRLLPTPVLAFAVRHYDTSAGVMVTASHNPATDNGFKVYLGGDDHGSQIIPPADADIAARIQHIADTVSVGELPRSQNYEVVDESAIDAYVDATATVAEISLRNSQGSFSASRTTKPDNPLQIVYTPLHGVGWETFHKVFEKAGFLSPTLVPEQTHPDPDFSTVSFPNPEEPDALNLAYTVARNTNAQLVLANDPDADRLAVAVPDVNAPHGYRRLSGNDVGLLLAWYVAENTRGDGAFACSVVSSPVLKVVAEEYDLNYVETLTGFKWISRTPGLIFGFEEALGYLVNPETVGDKDGISAAVAVVSLATELAAHGLTLDDQLGRFCERFGFFASSQISVRTRSISHISQIMAALRGKLPSHVGEVAITEIDDFSDGYGEFPPTDMLRFILNDGSRIMIRPSGTEPKLKIYVDVKCPARTLDLTPAPVGALAATPASLSPNAVQEQKSQVTKKLSHLEKGIRQLIDAHFVT